MFAKLDLKLPYQWLYTYLVMIVIGALLVPAQINFFIGAAIVFLSSLSAQFVLSFPMPSLGLQRYWTQLICAQACKWFVFSIMMYTTISHNLVSVHLFFGVIAAQIIVFWNYRKYG